jgi:hypothetical protein
MAAGGEDAYCIDVILCRWASSEILGSESGAGMLACITF